MEIMMVTVMMKMMMTMLMMTMIMFFGHEAGTSINKKKHRAVIHSLG